MHVKQPPAPAMTIYNIREEIYEKYRKQHLNKNYNNGRNTAPCGTPKKIIRFCTHYNNVEHIL